jgi:hypothetical protein
MPRVLSKSTDKMPVLLKDYIPSHGMYNSVIYRQQLWEFLAGGLGNPASRGMAFSAPLSLLIRNLPRKRGETALESPLAI